MSRHICVLHADVELPPYPGLANGCRHFTDEQNLRWCEECARRHGICQICGENVLLILALFGRNREEEES